MSFAGKHKTGRAISHPPLHALPRQAKQRTARPRTALPSPARPGRALLRTPP
jgi:hypothetical protein